MCTLPLGGHFAPRFVVIFSLGDIYLHGRQSTEGPQHGVRTFLPCLLLVQLHSEASGLQQPLPGARDRRSQPPLTAPMLGQVDPLGWLETGEVLVAECVGGRVTQDPTSPLPLECGSHGKTSRGEPPPWDEADSCPGCDFLALTHPYASE